MYPPNGLIVLPHYIVKRSEALLHSFGAVNSPTRSFFWSAFQPTLIYLEAALRRCYISHSFVIHQSCNSHSCGWPPSVPHTPNRAIRAVPVLMSSFDTLRQELSGLDPPIHLSILALLAWEHPPATCRHRNVSLLSWNYRRFFAVFLSYLFNKHSIDGQRTLWSPPYVFNTLSFALLVWEHRRSTFQQRLQNSSFFVQSVLFRYRFSIVFCAICCIFVIHRSRCANGYAFGAFAAEEDQNFEGRKTSKSM